MLKSIRSALISVFYKDNLAPLVQYLATHGVQLYSTGGTLKFIEELGLSVTAVETLTGFPEILGGRVKTLHPSVFGGILARRSNSEDLAQLQAHRIPEIDMVVVDLYPFEETVAAGKSDVEIIEKIDIGGISLIRAAAKNFADTLIISSRGQYAEVLSLLQKNGCATTLTERKHFAAAAFHASSHYDTQIFNYFNSTEKLLVFKQSLQEAQVLRYGENPHQQGIFYGRLSNVFDMLHGRELSYNNLVDIDAALQLVDEFTEPTVAIIKHTNSCGLASHSSLAEAYVAAYAGDPTSAFGGVLAVNRTIDVATATAMDQLFFEVLAAPAFEPAALEILQRKKNRILLVDKRTKHGAKIQFKSLLDGVLLQTTDNLHETRSQFSLVTKRVATEQELSDLEFAIKAVKHLKSNGIALVKNAQLIGMGCGQTSRVDSLLIALKKAREFGFDTHGAVMASEAFFPFPDCVNIAHEAGITAIAQPGGSIKDSDSIAAADANGQVMVMTGVRHFKH